MDIDLITKRMLKQTLSSNPEQLYVLRGEILDMPEYYIAAAPGTSQEEWDKKQFNAYIDQKKMLSAFLTQHEAEAFAQRQGCVLDMGEPLVVAIDNDAFEKLVLQYTKQDWIESVKIYGRAPIGLLFAPSDFNRGRQGLEFAPAEFLAEKAAPMEKPSLAAPIQPVQASQPVQEDEVPVAARVFRGVEEVKTAFETYEANARRKIDRGGKFENIHSLIQSLAQQNGIDPADLDTKFGFAEGYTRQFFINVNTLEPNIKVIKKYLTYFGLEGYLYLFRKDCNELNRYLGSHKHIDKYKLRERINPSAERFKLEKIIRGVDDDKTSFVYKIFLSSNRGNDFQMVVSNPLKPPLIIGREYQIVNRNGSPRDEDVEPPKMTSKTALPSESAMQELLAQMEEKEASKKGKKGDSKNNQRSYDEVRKDEIIQYFRKQGIDGRSADAKYKTLDIEEDILDEFYKYITKKQFGNLEIQGYTARKLIKELHMPPYDAFLSLVQLRADPKETKQRLIYRERDPQYQKSPNPAKGKGKGDKK